MSKYLDKFLSTIPATQAKQIFQILNEMKDSGAIVDPKEYNTKLQELSEYLRTTSPQPTLKFFEAFIGEEIDADKFNAMTKAINFDLETLFKEADNIATILGFHKFLYRLTVMQALKKNIDKLEKQINYFEFISRDIDGWTNMQHNTFNDISAGQTSRVKGDSGLFYDARRKIMSKDTEDCNVDLFGERLVMPSLTSEEIKIVDINFINDSETTSSERDLQHPTSSMRNVIDRKLYTYWIYPIILSSHVSSGVKIKLKLDLGGFRDFNMLQLEPASSFPMTLESLSYITEDNETETITINSSINKDFGLYLSRISAQYVTLIFRQDNAEELLYSWNPERDIWERVWKDDLDPEEADENRIDRLFDELNAVLPDPFIRDILDISSQEQQSVSAYQYSFGFDNIRLYLNKYLQNGVFVGEKLTTDKPVGQLGLRVNEENVLIDIGGSSYNQFSYEYSIVKEDYDISGQFLGRDNLPVLPVSYAGSVVNERLFITEASGSVSINDLSRLRFTPNVRVSVPVVYKNLSEELTIGTDYVVQIENEVSLVDYDTWVAVRDKIEDNSSAWTPPVTVLIKFSSPSVYSIYTISYDVSTRLSDNPIANTAFRRLNNYSSLKDNYLIQCSATRGDPTVGYSNLYFTVFMRNNYIYNTKTAALLDYKLLLSTFNTDKFTE